VAKHLIIMHGRSIKPAEAEMRKLILKAIRLGLERSGDLETWDKIQTGAIATSFAYFGDISNEIQAREDPGDRKALTATDPDHGGSPAFPHDLLHQAMDMTVATSARFTRSAYKKVLGIADDLRFLDDALSVVSFFGAIATFSILNEKILKYAKPDMAEYLMRKKTGSAIRERLQQHLTPAITAGDDIMLVTHSLGCMVAYDVFWKFSLESEYRNVRQAGNPVRKWLTIGCPLAEPGIRRNLRDGHQHPDDQFPRNVFTDWVNIWAQDDFISHNSKMARAFRDMKNRGFVDTISDKKIYNCWIYHDANDGALISNPHDLYGYLISKKVGSEISKWAHA
jgi:hypothetical protein